MVNSDTMKGENKLPTHQTTIDQIVNNKISYYKEFVSPLVYPTLKFGDLIQDWESIGETPVNLII